MGPIGWPELIILLVVVLIIFGPGKLPDIGKAVGNGIKEFRRASNDIEESLRSEPSKATPPPAATTAPAAPAAPTASGATTPPASTPSDKPS
jgi:sec-independent protein translocase protein TatA